MQQKDYYQILRIPATATAVQIKAAFRKLAIQYHPDKNNGDTLSEAVFKELNEAYGILSNPARKAKYDNEKVLQNSKAYTGKKPAVVTANTLLQQTIALNKLLASANPFTINKDGLFFKISSLLSPYHINILLLENNMPLNEALIQQVLLCCRHLSLADTRLLSIKLFNVAQKNAKLIALINEYLEQKKWDDYWQRYKIIAVLLFAVLLCLFIYYL